ncbi:MAG TPA: hypothetical protein VGS19_32740 [Streptosporangiaceae bacterium]|nr:hypothetical protein [Streptosporangiaceae bacterium]
MRTGRVAGQLELPPETRHHDYSEHDDDYHYQADEDHGLLPSATSGYLAAISG